MTLPPRPRLADHVLPRRHVIDGHEHVVLFDQYTGGVVRCGAREWECVAAADGTRDLEGIRLAARQRGAHASVAAIAELFSSLHAIGFIVAAQEPGARATTVVVVDDTPRERAIEPLPGFGLRCDRSGACCRMYATVMMTRAECERARTLLPDHRAGPVTHARFFMPIAGGEPSEIFTPTMLDGACGYLDADGACAIHRAAGVGAKPAGCAQFPTMFVDDGTSVRVSVRTECACVLDSGIAPGEAPLVDPVWRVAGDLPAHVAVTRLPARLHVRQGETIAREQARAWIDAWLQAPAPSDPATAVWAMADAIDARGLAAALPAWEAAVDPDPDRVAPWIDALHARAARRAREDVAWRGASDSVRQATTWLAMTTLLLRERDVLAELLAAGPEDAPVERFHLRAAAFGYAVFDRPLALALRDHAIRMWTARAMLSLVPPSEWSSPERRRPLARLDAICRAYGIRKYVDDLTTSSRTTRSTPTGG